MLQQRRCVCVSEVVRSENATSHCDFSHGSHYGRDGYFAAYLFEMCYWHTRLPIVLCSTGLMFVRNNDGTVVLDRHATVSRRTALAASLEAMGKRFIKSHHTTSRPTTPPHGSAVQPRPVAVRPLHFQLDCRLLCPVPHHITSRHASHHMTPDARTRSARTSTRSGATLKQKTVAVHASARPSTATRPRPLNDMSCVFV